MATIVWLSASVAFSYYLQNFANYDATYGSLGAVIGLMMWTWISVIILIVGAEINAEMEHQTAIDTTVGPPEADGPARRRGCRYRWKILRRLSARPQSEKLISIESPPVIEVAGNLSRTAAAGHVQPSVSQVSGIPKYVTVTANDWPAGLSIEIVVRTTDRTLNDVRSGVPTGLTVSCCAQSVTPRCQ